MRGVPTSQLERPDPPVIFRELDEETLHRLEERFERLPFPTAQLNAFRAAHPGDWINSN
ncbi:hypothetical protein [Streptomyces ipomoeae]|uniref:hypothetical protein n=1 Tax=Streptomyces ipomoeae TaxID=103232 RepID=UPI001C66A07F|nr:hypothetical protein [Streptomyces ipomoeae]MDX2932920.1 hypothetical protein [Streptomyces ipomoeae]